MSTTALNRRFFLKGSIVGGLAAMTAGRSPGPAAAVEAPAAKPTARRSLLRPATTALPTVSAHCNTSATKSHGPSVIGR